VGGCLLLACYNPVAGGQEIAPHFSWNSISLEKIDKVITSIPKRLTAVITNKAYHTKY
jgi:hypothetical protein